MVSFFQGAGLERVRSPNNYVSLVLIHCISYKPCANCYPYFVYKLLIAQFTNDVWM